MSPLYEVKNDPGKKGQMVNLASLSYVGACHYLRRSTNHFNIVTAGELISIDGGGNINIEDHRNALIEAWEAYRASKDGKSVRHQRHRIEKGDNHAILDLYEVLYIGALMELSDGKYGFPIILRSTGMPINVSFDRESEALKAHVALDNAYGDYLDNLNQQGV